MTTFIGNERVPGVCAVISPCQYRSESQSKTDAVEIVLCCNFLRRDDEIYKLCGRAFSYVYNIGKGITVYPTLRNRGVYSCNHNTVLDQEILAYVVRCLYIVWDS